MDYSEYKKTYQKISFYDQIRNNKIKSWILMIIIVGIIVALMYIIAQVYNPALTFVFLIIGIVFSLLYVWIGYYFSDKIALASVKAYEANDKKYNHLNNLVDGLSLAAGLQKPKVYIMPSQELNAFATGRNPENGVVCVTEGLLDKLNDKELEGVIAHELIHIRNLYIRFVTLAIVLVGLIAIISEVFLRSLFFSNSDDKDNKNILFLIIGIAIAILAPILANLVQLAISRKREYMADAGAVQLTRDNTGLINALKKISKYYETNEKTIANKTVSSMFISSPFSGKSLSNLFSTHPSTESRIKALEAM